MHEVRAHDAVQIAAVGHEGERQTAMDEYVVEEEVQRTIRRHAKADGEEIGVSPHTKPD